MSASVITDGGPAFPLPVAEIQGHATHSGDFGEGMTGMSLRDYFAAHALPAVIAFEDRALDTHDALPMDAMARQAYELADAMLRARTGRPGAQS